jgi:hypothetical protein
MSRDLTFLALFATELIQEKINVSHMMLRKNISRVSPSLRVARAQRVGSKERRQHGLGQI